MMEADKTPTLWKAFIGLKCPRCRTGHLFNKGGFFTYKKVLEMPEKCENCHFKYEIENGFWLGAMWISYPIVVAIELPFLFLALFAEGYMTWVYFLMMITAFILLWPFMLRAGRALWIYVNVPFENVRN